ncbi:hypothetical protein HanRHA438_Chr11g0498691 [Helianthus annuus]|nr:hypothetical protein HanRHA438_Chr11g0498691 [Helianthus annuus]
MFDLLMESKRLRGGDWCISRHTYLVYYLYQDLLAHTPSHLCKQIHTMGHVSLF